MSGGENVVVVRAHNAGRVSVWLGGERSGPDGAALYPLMQQLTMGMVRDMHYPLCMQLGGLFAEGRERAITLRVVPEGWAVASAAVEALTARLAASSVGLA